MRASTVAAVVAGAGLPVVLAQSSGLGDISSGCQNAFLGVAANPEAASCLNVNGLLSAVTSTKADDSLVQPITNWVTGMCSAGPCSNDTLSAVVHNITTGCSNELSGLGLKTSDSSDLVNYVQLGYPTVRKVLCLKDNDSNKLCVNEDLSAIESATGKTLSINNIMGLTSNVSALANLPKDVICSSCQKAIFSTVKQDFPSLVNGEFTNVAQNQCGADFVNGEVPSSIAQTASSTSSSSSSNKDNAASSSFGISFMNVFVASTVALVSSIMILG